MDGEELFQHSEDVTHSYGAMFSNNTEATTQRRQTGLLGKQNSILTTIVNKLEDQTSQIKSLKKVFTGGSNSTDMAKQKEPEFMVEAFQHKLIDELQEVVKALKENANHSKGLLSHLPHIPHLPSGGKPGLPNKPKKALVKEEEKLAEDAAGAGGAGAKPGSRKARALARKAKAIERKLALQAEKDAAKAATLAEKEAASALKPSLLKRLGGGLKGPLGTAGKLLAPLAILGGATGLYENNSSFNSSKNHSLFGDASTNGIANSGAANIGREAGYGAMTGAAIGSIIPGVGTAIGGAVGGVAGAAYGTYKQYEDQIDPVLKKIRDSIKPFITNTGMALSSFASRATQATETVLNDLATKSGKLLSSVDNFVMRHIPSMDDIEKAIPANMKELGDLKDKIVTAASALILSAKNWIMDHIPSWDTIKDDMQSLVDKANHFIHDTLPAAAAAVGGAVVAGGKAVVAGGKAVVKAATPYVKAAGQEVVDEAIETKQSFNRGIVHFRDLHKEGTAWAPRILNANAEASKTVGVDRAELDTFAQLESAGGKSNSASTSSAQGTFQFITNHGKGKKGTWEEMVDKYGKQYGIGEGDIHDARANAIMGALYLRDNKKALAKTLGRKSTATEDYMAHFLGTTGAKNQIPRAESDPTGIAADANPSAARANAPLFYADPKNKTGAYTNAEFTAQLNSRVQAAADRSKVNIARAQSNYGVDADGNAVGVDMAPTQIAKNNKAVKTDKPANPATIIPTGKATAPAATDREKPIVVADNKTPASKATAPTAETATAALPNKIKPGEIAAAMTATAAVAATTLPVAIAKPSELATPPAAELATPPVPEAIDKPAEIASNATPDAAPTDTAGVGREDGTTVNPDNKELFVVGGAKHNAEALGKKISTRASALFAASASEGRDEINKSVDEIQKQLAAYGVKMPGKDEANLQSSPSSTVGRQTSQSDENIMKSFDSRNSVSTKVTDPAQISALDKIFGITPKNASANLQPDTPDAVSRAGAVSMASSDSTVNADGSTSTKVTDPAQKGALDKIFGVGKGAPNSKSAPLPKTTMAGIKSNRVDLDEIPMFMADSGLMMVNLGHMS